MHFSFFCVFYFTYWPLFCANLSSASIKMAVHDISAPVSIVKSNKGNSELSCSFAELKAHSELQTSRFTCTIYCN